jgi:hypothetical protein
MAGSEKSDVVGHARSLGVCEPRETIFSRRTHPQSGQLACQPFRIDPPQGLEEFDQADPGGIGG